MGELHFLIVHPIEKFHSTMFTPSTFPKSPTLPSDSFKAPLWALVSRILGAVHPKSRPRAMWAWHSWVEKKTYLMRCDLNLCRRCKSKALENLLVEQDVAGFYFTSNLWLATVKRTINQWIAASRFWSPNASYHDITLQARPLPNTEVACGRQWWIL